MKAESADSVGLPSLLVPLTVLAAVVAGVFYALTRLVPPLLEASATPPGASLPLLASLLPYATRHPFPCALAVLLAGGIAFLAGPRDHPLRLTACFIGGAFVLALWCVLLLLVPQTCCLVEAP